MRNFKKQIIIIYIYFILFLLIGKTYVEVNLPNLFSMLFQPISFFLLFILCFRLNKEFKERRKKKKELLDTIIIIMMVYGIIYFLSGLLFTL